MSIGKRPRLQTLHPKLYLTGVTALLLFGSLPVGAQSVRQDKSGSLSVVADEMPLEDLFREMSALGLIDAALLDPQIGDVRVTLEADELTPGEAIMAILEAADVAFTLQGAPGKPFRVLLESVGESGARPEVLPPPSPLREDEPPDPSLYEPARQREVTGDAVPATGAAGLDGRPGAKSVGWTLFVLSAGLLLGIACLKGFKLRSRSGDPLGGLVKKPLS